ncbi:MAG: MBL fold metallo-hydrolase [Polynucleobacter sp. 39-45-136]|jgi:glyoxylase-like metal-dependent hydrolase (beta-lactamase superfamily II)|nr:MAG: MBL fold metallo-hydrolase [Polynucleobacter sp. 39-45-136]
MKKYLLAILLVATFNSHLLAQTLKTQKINESTYALIGEIGGRTYENQGLNANYGAVVTKDGVILIDSGASKQGAELINKEVQKITGQKIRWVINTGSQDHRWLGNDYFISQGAEVIALGKTVTTQKLMAGGQEDSVKAVLKDRFTGTKPAYAQKPITQNDVTLDLGGTKVQIKYLNHAHFEGDVVVYFPDQNIMFSGDHIYVDRLLGVLPQSNASTWLDAFNQIESINPKVIVPGHGNTCDLTKAKKQTGDYLKFLVEGTKKYAEDMAGVEAAIKGLSNAPQFEKLANFNELHKGNISRTYLRLEAQ